METRSNDNLREIPVATREFFAFAAELAEISGDYIRPYFGRPGLAIDRKADDSPVTQADRGAEELLREAIGKKYPDHGIIGEEFGETNAEAEFVWVLDPIDGTVSFASACPLFGTLIGLLHNGKPILGLIHQPVLRQLCIGTTSGTYLNGTRVTLREPENLRRSTLLTTDLAHIQRHRDYNAFDRLRSRAAIFRTWGDCYGYLLVASGWADVMIDPIMNPWDILPVIPVIEGAGGMISGWSGEDAAGADSCVAAHPKLHAEVIHLLNNRVEGAKTS